METIGTGYTREVVERIKEEVQKIVIEQEDLIDFSLVTLLSGGHVLLEGVPGLAKTLTVRTIAKAIAVDFKRVQFTPDLMPADITGTKIYDMKNGVFELKKGPLFTHFFLGDEINRTPPKTQSALLQAMEEKKITIDGENYGLPEPYMIFATQNPIEYEGTYPLPEALIDRFMMKLIVDYPSKEAEKEVLYHYHKGFSENKLELSEIQAVCSAEDIMKCKEEIQKVQVDESLFQYIMEIIEMTRKNTVVSMGSSPRGSIALLMAAKTYGAINGRDYVTPDDIKELAIPILRHRMTLKPEAEIEGTTTDQVISNILAHIKVPR